MLYIICIDMEEEKIDPKVLTQLLVQLWSRKEWTAVTALEEINDTLIKMLPYMRWNNEAIEGIKNKIKWIEIRMLTIYPIIFTIHFIVLSLIILWIFYNIVWKSLFYLF